MITGLVAAQLCAACSSGDDLIVPDDNLHPISFSTADTSAQVTRADNTVGLEKLFTEIKVYGYKTLTSTAQDGTTTTTLQNVMPGYTLKYVDGTANSSTSNTTGWEYVGLTDKNGEAVKDYTGNVQEIKYWDGNSSDYRFFGVIPNDKYTLKYDGKVIDKDPKIDDTKSFTMEFPNLTYMTRTYDATNKKYKYLTYKTDNDGNTTSGEIPEKDIPMYGTMWQGDPKDNYDKPVTLAFSKPYALIRIVFVRPDGSSVTQLGDPDKNEGENGYYAAKFNPTDKSKISTDGSVKVTWSMKGTEESTTAESTEQKLPAMNFNPMKLEEAETRYQAWPEYVMVPTTTDASTGTSSSVDYECTVFVKEETTSGNTTSSKIVSRTAFVPKEFTHWKAGYEYTYVFKITYNNSLEFSHVVETYTKWQAGYVNETKW